jgi:hypothetical protein
MAGLFKRLYDWLLRLFWYVQFQRRSAAAPWEAVSRPWTGEGVIGAGRCENVLTLRCRATEMDITMIGYVDDFSINIEALPQHLDKLLP